MNPNSKGIFNQSLVLRWLVGLFDIIVLLVATFLVTRFLDANNGSVSFQYIRHCLFLSALTYMLSFIVLPSSLFDVKSRSHVLLGRVVRLSVFYSLLLTVVLFCLNSPALNKETLPYHLVAAIVAISIERFIFRQVLSGMSESGPSRTRILLVGSPDEFAELIDRDRSRGRRSQIEGIFCSDSEVQSDQKCLGTPDEAVAFLKSSERPFTVYCGLQGVDAQTLNLLYYYCDNKGVTFYAVSQTLNALGHRLDVVEVDNVPALQAHPEALSYPSNRVLKRTFDVVISALFLLTLFPIIYMVVMVLIKSLNSGPVFDVRRRVGINGREFSCIRFRTTAVAQEDAFGELKTPATFGFGDLMRRFHIDALPQFINVLAGNMSLVGPHCHTPSEAREYGRYINRYKVRKGVKPGITGWSQVKGIRYDAQAPDSCYRLMDADVWYMENWNIWLDIEIIISSFFVRKK